MFRSLLINSQTGELCTTFRAGETVELKILIEDDQEIHDLRLSVGINSPRGERLFAVATFLGTYSRIAGESKNWAVGRFELPALMQVCTRWILEFRMGPTNLLDAVYSATAFEVADSGYLGVPSMTLADFGVLQVRSNWLVQGVSNA